MSDLVLLLFPIAYVIVSWQLVFGKLLTNKTPSDWAFVSWLEVALAMSLVFVASSLMSITCHYQEPECLGSFSILAVCNWLPFLIASLVAVLAGIRFSFIAFLDQHNWTLLGIAAITVILILGAVVFWGRFPSDTILATGALYYLILFVSSLWWFLAGRKNVTAGK